MESTGGFGTLKIELRDESQLADLVDLLARMKRAPALSITHDRVAVMAPRDNARRLISRSEILYGTAIGDYVRIVTDEGRFLIRGRISEMEQRWKPFGFIRTHRGYVVNGSRVEEVRGNGNGTAILRLDGGATVPVSRRRLATVRAALVA